MNVNIINKKIVSERNNQSNKSVSKISSKNKELINNSSTNNLIENKNEQNKIKNNHNESVNLLYNYSIGNLTNRSKNKAIKIKPIKHIINNNNLFNLSSQINFINKDECFLAEEIHFKAVRYMQEIQKIDSTFDNT